MHAELYKKWYPTLQDFLDDVAKMVHNADVRSHKDLARLYKAQAMLTAAQVRIQEFDSQLKVECERVAVRERLENAQCQEYRGHNSFDAPLATKSTLRSTIPALHPERSVLAGDTDMLLMLLLPDNASGFDPSLCLHRRNGT
jgi:hypothetical protein